jgi:holo-[acyl-carrier protein] synthase
VICGSGVDIIEIDRIRKAFKRWKDSFPKRVFTQKEIEYCQRKKDPAAHYAARFAAKEALIKALASRSFKRIRLSEIEIVADQGRERPKVTLYGTAKELADALNVRSVFVSIAHDNKYAVAQVILESREHPLSLRGA